MVSISEFRTFTMIMFKDAGHSAEGANCFTERQSKMLKQIKPITRQVLSVRRANSTVAGQVCICLKLEKLLFIMMRLHLFARYAFESNRQPD